MFDFYVTVADPEIRAALTKLETRVGILEDKVAELKVANEANKTAVETLTATHEALKLRIESDTANFLKKIQELKDQIAAGGDTTAVVADLTQIATELHASAASVHAVADSEAAIDPDPTNA